MASCSRRTSAGFSEPAARSGCRRAQVEDLVGVDVADAGDHRLVEQQRLEPASAARRAAPAGWSRRGRRRAGRGRVGPARAARRRRGRGRTRRPRRTCGGRRTTAPRRVRRTSASDDVGVRRAGGPGGRQQQLAGHPQVDHHRVAGVERAQQVLAAPPGVEDRRPGQAVDDLLGRRAPHRALAADLDRLDRPADDPRGEPPPDGLDLRQLRHRRRGRRRAGRTAAAAAACSAAFFERPVPSPTTSPSTTTEAKNRLAWSGPSARVTYSGGPGPVAGRRPPAAATCGRGGRGGRRSRPGGARSGAR